MAGIHFAYSSKAWSMARDVALAQGAAVEFRRHVVAPAPVQLVGVGHVARGLLEVRHQPPPLEDLREDVRDVLAGDVRAAELRDRVVAVLVEDPRVELLGARDRPRRPATAGGASMRSANSSRNSRRSDLADRE
jgi:hypothetical protein